MQQFSSPKRHVSILTHLILFLVVIVAPFIFVVPRVNATCRTDIFCSGTETQCDITSGSNYNVTLCCDSPLSCTNEKNLPDCIDNANTSHAVSCKTSYNDPVQKISTTKIFYCRDSTSCIVLQKASKDSANTPVISICDVAGDQASACNACTSRNGIWTALGCIPFEQDAFVLGLIRIIMGVAGFIALSMMIVGTVILMTGGGNQEQMKKGKEIFTGAIIGLLFLIFSVVILQIITNSIIKLPLPGTPGTPCTSCHVTP